MYIKNQLLNSIHKAIGYSLLLLVFTNYSSNDNTEKIIDATINTPTSPNTTPTVNYADIDFTDWKEISKANLFVTLNNRNIL